MSVFRYCLLFFCICVFSLLSHAQEATEEPDSSWEIIERCVGEPITPPDDWTFEGTILATGWAGIHGMNTDFDVPQVQVFREHGWLNILHSYSPDFRWYAVGIGAYSDRCPQCFRHQYDLYRIVVYSTVNRGERYIYEPDSYFEYSPNPANNPRLVWYDNDHLVLTRDGSFTFGIHRFLWNPSTGEETDFDPVISPLLSVDQYFPSTDRSIAIYREWSAVNVIVPETGKILNAYDGVPSLFSVWSPNNQYFANPSEYSQIKLYFHETGEIQTIFQVSDEQVVNTLEWSADSQYLSFLVRSTETSETETFIVDVQSQTIYSSCGYFDSGAWSPNTNQISVTLPHDNAIYIFDIENWQLINTGIYHEGNIIGWRDDPDE